MASIVRCTVCGNDFSDDAIVTTGERSVCSGCMPVFLQRLREGIPVTGTAVVYGGFWIRFLAKMIDGVVLTAIALAVVLVMRLLLFRTGIEMNLVTLFYYPVNIAYVTYFVGSHGATPGKMALGLSVIRSDGGKVTHGRAFGRFWAEMVTGFTFGIGYIIAGFDSEKRALHDYICDTRVVKA